MVLPEADATEAPCGFPDRPPGDLTDEAFCLPVMRLPDLETTVVGSFSSSLLRRSDVPAPSSLLDACCNLPEHQVPTPRRQQSLQEQGFEPKGGSKGGHEVMGPNCCGTMSLATPIDPWKQEFTGIAEPGHKKRLSEAGIYWDN